MKKIAVFHPSSELYGADRILVNALEAYEEAQLVIYLPSNGPLIELIHERLPQAQVKIIGHMPIISRSMYRPAGLLKVWKANRQFKKFLKNEHKTEGFNMAYVNTLACVFILPFLRRLKIPAFIHVHEILENPRFVAWMTAKMAFHYAQIVISVSHAVQSNLHRLVSRRRAESCVVHNGILPIEVRQGALPRVGISFYLFGRIKPEKGQWYLVEALKQLNKEELEHAEFHIVGDVLKGREDLKLDLLEKIQLAGLNDRFVFHGFKADIAAEMAKADVCLVPSLMKDPFPTTVLEAMSAGKLVISTDTGGAKEAISNGVDGFLIDALTPCKFAELIRQIIRDPKQIEPMGESAKKTYLENFTIEKFNERWSKAMVGF